MDNGIESRMGNAPLIVMKHTDINIYAGIKSMSEQQREYAKKGSLEVTDEASKAVQKTPHRVSLDSIKAKILFIDYWYPPRHPHFTVCLITMKNGFILVGKSAPADPENFDLELGKQFAYEDAVRQIWPLEAYLLREQLSVGPEPPQPKE